MAKAWPLAVASRLERLADDERTPQFLKRELLALAGNIRSDYALANE